MIWYLLWLGVTIVSFCFSMQQNKPIIPLLPNDIATKILTIPCTITQQHYEEIFKNVKNIQTCDPHNKDDLKKYFHSIQNILFPTFGLAQTCRNNYSLDIRKKIVESAKQSLFNELPQGILFFMLPKKIQNTLFGQLHQKILNDLDEKYRKPDIGPGFYDNFGASNDELNNIIYYRNNEIFNSNRVIEYIINTLKPHLILNQNMILDLRNMPTPTYIFMLILNHICTHGVVDLRTPISDGSCSTAQYINNTLHLDRLSGFFSPTSRAKILNTHEYPNSTFEYPKEKKEIIEAFITFYFNLNQTKSD
jgi:hypothetical protein